MINEVLNLFAPHLCSGCGFIGPLLCDCCKYDILYDSFNRCILCGEASRYGVCEIHIMPFKQAWCVGERRTSLEHLINQFKFERVRSAANALAYLLNETIPVLPPETVVIPLPTAQHHIRERGYDHSLLIARAFARLRKHSVQKVLGRHHAKSQRGATYGERLEQASSAFYTTIQLSPSISYLLIDDVVTTGATVQHAANTLKQNGAEIIYVGLLARQPLD